LAGNNFPTSDDLWNGAIVPARKDVIENDLHVGKEIGGALLASHLDPSQDRHVDRQPCGGFRPFHQRLGNVKRMKHHPLARPGDVWKQAMFNRVVFGARRGVMGDAEVEPQAIGEGLSRFLEHLTIGGIAATAVAEQQEATGVGIMLGAVLFPPMGDAVAVSWLV
jgi:hypothetical protein